MRHLVCALLALTAVYFSCLHHGRQGSQLAFRLQELESSEAELVLIGSSICRKGVDAETFASYRQVKTLKACENGGASAWWHLYVKNVLGKSEHRPQAVLIFFRDHFLTEPKFRTKGPYAKALRALSESEEAELATLSSPWHWIPEEAQEWLQTRLVRRSASLFGAGRAAQEQALRKVFAENRMRSEWMSQMQLASEETKSISQLDFDARLTQSFLPQILDTLELRGIQAIFVRMKRRRDLSPEAESPELQDYIYSLENYLHSRHAVLIDFTHDTRLDLECFGHGDHLNAAGRQLFTQLLSDSLTFMGQIDNTSPSTTVL